MELKRKAWVLTEDRISVGMPPLAGFLLTLIGSAIRYGFVGESKSRYEFFELNPSTC